MYCGRLFSYRPGARPVLLIPHEEMGRGKDLAGQEWKGLRMGIEAGMSHTESVIVNKGNIASAVGSGLVDVFATPMMVALLELAASQCIASALEAGQVSVGTHVDVEHSGATPVGMRVSATATVTAVERRRVDFEVVVKDEVGEVGRGRHTRFIVDKAKFMEKAQAKAK